MNYSSSSALTRCAPPSRVYNRSTCSFRRPPDALHIQLCHPSGHQLKSVVKRYLFTLDMDNAIDRTTRGSHVCASLRQTPQVRIEQSSNPPPDAVGVAFAADVIKRSRQLNFSAEGMHIVFHTLPPPWRRRSCFSPQRPHPAVHTDASIRRPTRSNSH